MSDGGVKPHSQSGAPPLIRVEGLERRYELGATEVRAVDGVTLSIERGEAVAILGPSGSGKSTLMHLIGALDRPTAGTIEVDGEPIGQLGGAPAARYRNANIGFVFQQFHLQSHLTALENVTLPLKLAGVPRDERRKRAAELLDLVGLGDRMDHRPTELSGGQQQRVSIARALANDPVLLLADEPTGNLDSATGRDVIALFLRLRAERGLTVVLVTHDAEVAARMARVIRMRDGAVVADEPGAGDPGGGEPLGAAATDALAASPARSATRGGALAAFFDDLRDVWLGLGRQRARAALTAFGIAIGGMAIALMVGLGLGLHEFIVTQAESVNDPLSVWVVNSEFSVGDIVGNRAQQLGKPPQPLKQRTLHKLATARSGFTAFTDEQIEQVRAIDGVVSVRPRTYVILDGVRLLAEGAASEAARDGGPDDFPETYYIGYSLVRAEGARFRIEAGRGFEASDDAHVILSYQYAEAWGTTPEALVGRKVELLFPALGGLSDFNWIRPQEIDARYRGYTATVVGVTTKSILSSVVFLYPTFGERISHFQFDGRDVEGDMLSSGPTAMLAQLVELGRMAADPALLEELDGATDRQQRLAEVLRGLTELVGRRPAADPKAGAAGGNPMAALLPLMARLGELRALIGDEQLARELREAGGRRARLLRSLSPLLGMREVAEAGSPDGADPPDAADGEPSTRWGARIRVRVASKEALPGVKEALRERGMKVRTLQEELAMVSRIFGVIDAFLSSFGLIALVVAGLGIANTLIMAVMERTREIGVMKAVGATEGRVRRLFAMEALLIGLLGGVAGVALALGLGELLNARGVAWLAPDWDGFRFFDWAWWLVGGTIAFCGLIGLLAGLYPAHRAARLDPIEALRSD